VAFTGRVRDAGMELGFYAAATLAVAPSTRLSLRKLAPRRGRCQHGAVRPERLDGELVSVDLPRWRRRAGEARCEGPARHRRLPAVSHRAAAVMKTRHVEVGHRELQLRRSPWHVGEREARRAGAPREGRGKRQGARRGQGKREAGNAKRRGIFLAWTAIDHVCLPKRNGHF